jgi:CDP-diacylglycerol---glycerol-3-phosphate 3-phosphatidyltransferase
MNLPNRLTILRLVLTLPFVAALSFQFPGAKLLALVLFIASSVTDYADGYIARKFKLITDFGKLMDPLVDKIMTISAFICLVSLGSIPAWAVIVIVSREFLITGLRLMAAVRGKVLPAERLGKLKTVCQIVTILYCLILVATADHYLPQCGRLNPGFFNRRIDALVGNFVFRQELGSRQRAVGGERSVLAPPY